MGIEADSSELAVIADTGAQIRAGSNYVFLMQTVSGGYALALYPCGVLTVNDVNLAMVREAAEESEQDSE